MTSFVIIGEAWGEKEEQFSFPFVGPSGAELYRMLGEAGFPCEHLPYNYVSPFRMSQLWMRLPHPLLNVFNARPPDPEQKNRVEYFYAKLADKVELDRTLPRRRFGSSFLYVKKEFGEHVHALHKKLYELQPNLIIALGATACWALGLIESIGKIRGSIHETKFGKVIPCYHPAAILRNWSNRTVTVLDLFKCRKEMEFPHSVRVSREIWTEPTIADLQTWWEQHGSTSSLLAFDIETVRKAQISEVGFASDAHHALHIPFIIEEDKQYVSYWKTLEEEVLAWQFVKQVLESQVPKLTQNGKYDIYWLVKEFGIPVRNWTHDTMQKAHCWQPELQKSLQFLGSIFMSEMDWKSIRRNVGKEE